MKNFNSLVEKIKELTIDEQEELHHLLQKFLIEARRDEVRKNFKESKRKEKKLKFSANISELKKFAGK